MTNESLQVLTSLCKIYFLVSFFCFKCLACLYTLQLENVIIFIPRLGQVACINFFSHFNNY